MAKQGIFNNKDASTFLILWIKISSWIFFFLMMGALLMLQFWPYLIIFLHLKIMIFHFHLQSLSGKTLSNSSISSFFFLSSYLYYMFSKKKCYLYIICNKILKFGQIVLCLHVHSLCKHFICIYYLFYMKHTLVFFF